MNLNKLNMWRRAPLQTNVASMVNLSQITFAGYSTKNKNSSSSSSSDSDVDLPKKIDAETKNKETVTKLNNLLQELIQNDVVAKSSKLDLAKPKNKRIPKEERESKKIESTEMQLIKAVTDVAKDIGGNTKQTESELLAKLLGPNNNTPSSKNLNDIIKDMKIDREVKTKEKSKAEQVRNILQHMRANQRQESRKEPIKIRKPQQLRTRQEMVLKRIDLFGNQPLGIFTNKDLQDNEIKTWQKLHKQDLKLAVTHPPSNYFQQMILWTEQGKLWKFPIDNEQGLEEEKKVDFTKHIFLEEHLEPWCPPKGPIRHYMELVCVGLSKNPYLTVEAKIEHIEWYKNYFEEKKKLLQEVGAIPSETNTENQKQIE
ncbi:28S ribosomal protein S31, mitochondrial [Diorhabda sublineata]|uniref:28S ribosomal protein S31, mitochondrial n=1 Tax=Diorhabda sublineata TaxID=1163346 RepID=UPI0024E08B42|nr:28S ribosomal protein S31, mitochondrial [Diorhabda sublineata]